MKWVWIALAAVAALVLVVSVVGAILPRAHRASSTVVIKQPVSSVWGAIRNIAGATAWWPGLTLSERLSDVNGKERWHQKGSSFDMVVEITDDVAPTHMATLIIGKPGDPFGGRWAYDLAPAQGGTRVTITEDGWVSNVIFRCVSRFVMGYYGTMDGYLVALGRKFGESVHPEHTA